MSKYEIYIDKINSARSIEELKQITDEIENNFNGIEKSSLINKIESKKSEVNTISNEVKSDVTSKSNDTISINKSTLKKAGIIGLFAGVAILSSVVTAKLNKGNDYNTANNIPTQTVADVPTYTDSQYEPTTADNETTVAAETTLDTEIETTVAAETTLDTEIETTVAAETLQDETVVSSPMPSYFSQDDSFLNNYQLTAAQWEDYSLLKEPLKRVYRHIYYANPELIGLILAHYGESVRLGEPYNFETCISFHEIGALSSHYDNSDMINAINNSTPLPEDNDLTNPSGACGYLSKYNITQDEVQEYLLLSPQEKQVFRSCNVHNSQIVQFAVDYDGSTVEFSDGTKMTVNLKRLADICQNNGYSYMANKVALVTSSQKTK